MVQLPCRIFSLMDKNPNLRQSRKPRKMNLMCVDDRKVNRMHVASHKPTMNIEKLPAEIIEIILSYLDCCSTTSCKVVWSFDQKVGKRACRKIWWYGNACLKKMPEAYFIFLNAIATYEPGFDRIRFSTTAERAAFIAWLRDQKLAFPMPSYGFAGKWDIQLLI